MWERTICGIRAGELDISLVRGIGNTRTRLHSYGYRRRQYTVGFNFFDSFLSTLPNSTLDTNDDAVRMLGYCTPPARHRRYPTIVRSLGSKESHIQSHNR